MREAHITLPELALVAGTRAALGAGIALLLADRLGPSERRALGWGLVAVGVATTVPLAFEVLGKSRSNAELREFEDRSDGRLRMEEEMLATGI